MSRRARALLAAVVLLVGVGVGVGLLLRGGPTPSVVSARTWVPQAATIRLLGASHGALADALAEQTARFDGSAGAVVAMGVAVGLPRWDRASLQQAGFAADGDAALFVWQGHLWAVLTGVGAAAERHVLETLDRRGVVATLQSSPEAAVAAWNLRRGEVEAALWRPEPGVLLLRWEIPKRIAATLGTAEDAGAAAAAETGKPADLAALRAASRGVPALPDEVAVQLRADLGRGDALRPALRAAVGPAGLLVGRVIDQIEGIDLALHFRGEAPAVVGRLRVKTAVAEEFAKYHQGFLADEAALDLGTILPDEVAAWGRIRVNPALLDMIPGFLRDRILPTDLLGRVHPALAKLDAQSLLIGAWDGQLAAGLLGIDDTLALTPAALRDLQASLSHAGLFLAVGLGDAKSAGALVSAAQGALQQAGLALQAVSIGPGRGFSVGAKAGEVLLPTTVLAVGSGVVVVAGQGEQERLERAARGRFPTLGAAAVTPLEKSVASGKELWLGLGSTTGRVVRAARRRGIPEHFVRMIPPALTARVQLDREGLLLRFEARPHAAPKGAR